ncbi:hypothetical protein AWN76_017285 [Rhodothermaceae bacterium RA]|nr:hypothetical protein AWN76_017285 [Rhodothermaceae bacterium RA]
MNMFDRTRTLAILLPLVAWLFLPGVSRAQFKNKPLAVGNLVYQYSEVGGEREGWYSGRSLRWPRILAQDNTRVNVVWIGARNVQRADGQTQDYMVVHVGPRVSGAGEMFPIEFRTVSRFEPPTVTVKLGSGQELESTDYFVDNDAVNPNLPADRMIYTEVNTALGITMKRRAYAFGQEYNDNYHIQEFVLINTGNMDDDEEIEVEQTLEGVYLHFQKRYQLAEFSYHPGGPDGWGANVMNDIVGDGMEDYEVDFRAQYTWLGNARNADAATFDEAGYPMLAPLDWSQPSDSSGRLTVPQFVGTVTLHADTSPSDRTDDPAQPSSTGHIDSDAPILSGNDAFDSDRSRADYLGAIEVGHMYPHHADIVDPDGDFTEQDGTPQLGKAGGYSSMYSYGPYTLAPGDSVRIVIAEGVDGLDPYEAFVVGSEFKRLANHRRDQMTPELAQTPNITYRGLTLSKNQWWFSGKDSLFQTFQRALDVYAASNEMTTYPIPAGPLPPKVFRVESGVDNVNLSWELYPEAETPAGFELYRARTYVEGPADDGFRYTCIAGCPGTPELGPSARSFSDPLPRGIEQYYYLQVVSNEVTPAGSVATPAGVRLKSNRYYTQTWDPASTSRGPGATTSSFKIVPNPLNIAANESVRYTRGNTADRIGFLDIPGQCTIRIYTETGELVKTIEHTTGTGDEYWNLTTDSQQVIVSGLYIVVVDNHEDGSRAIKKFVVIR